MASFFSKISTIFGSTINIIDYDTKERRAKLRRVNLQKIKLDKCRKKLQEELKSSKFNFVDEYGKDVNDE